MTTPTTLDDLDRRHHAATKLVRRRAAIAAAKAFTIGNEPLDALVERVADLYDLSPADRATLRPERGIAAIETSSRIAGFLRPMRATFGVGEALSLVRKAGRVARAVRRGGRVAGRAVPLATIAWGGYALGTAGWLYWHAEAYNEAAYDLLRRRIAPALVVADPRG